MGVKSTVRLTRKEAEAQFVSNYIDAKRNKAEIKAKQKVLALSNVALEDALEDYNDFLYRDTMGGFDNYLITESTED